MRIESYSCNQRIIRSLHRATRTRQLAALFICLTDGNRAADNDTDLSITSVGSIQLCASHLSKRDRRRTPILSSHAVKGEGRGRIAACQFGRLRCLEKNTERRDNAD